MATFHVRRACGCVERVKAFGSDAAHDARLTRLEGMPCQHHGGFSDPTVRPGDPAQVSRRVPDPVEHRPRHAPPGIMGRQFGAYRHGN